MRDDDVRGVALDRVRPQRRAHLAHQRGGAGVVPLDVADDERDVVVGQRDDVVPVSAELETRGGGQIAGDGDRAGQPGQAARQKGTLKHADQFVLGVEGVGAHQRLPGETRHRGEQSTFVGCEVVRLVPADQAGAGRTASGGQRKHGEAAGTHVRERGLQFGAGGPDRGAALAQRRGERGHRPHRCVGPLRTPLGPPQLRPRLRFGRVEHGHHEPVALQLGEGDAVGPQRFAQGGHHGPADVTDGTRGGEGRGEPLDAGDVADGGAQLGGVGDRSHQPCRVALPGGQQPPAQPQPLGLAGRLEDAELQFPVADGHVVGLHHGHQRGQIVRHGPGEQGLDPAVELLGLDAEQAQHFVVDLDPAAFHREAEKAGRQLLGLVLGGNGTGDGLGQKAETFTFLGVEPPQGVTDGDQAPAFPQRQGREREVPDGEPLRGRAAGQVLGGQPYGPSGAVRVRRGATGGQGVDVTESVQRARYAGGLGEAQPVPVGRRDVDGRQRRSGEDERLFQRAAQALARIEVRAEGLEGKFGTECSRSASRSAVTAHSAITALCRRSRSPCEGADPTCRWCGAPRAPPPAGSWE